MLLLLLMGQTPQGNAPSLWTYGGFYDGKAVEFRVTRSDVEAAPLWLPSADHPPLSPRAAIQSARAMLRKVLINADEWRFGEIRLVPIVGDAWVYVVGFRSPVPPLPVPVMPPRPLRPGEIISVAGSRPATLMDVPVLMDGRAVEPNVTPVNPGGR
jgi:hypothetical protein